jgi:hypothetical protein
VAHARAQQVLEQLDAVDVAVGQVGPLREGSEDRLVLRPHVGADPGPDLALAAGDRGAQHPAGLLEAGGVAQLDEARDGLLAVELDRDPLHVAVVEQVDQVAADQEHVGVSGLPAQFLSGAVDVGDDLDTNPRHAPAYGEPNRCAHPTCGERARGRTQARKRHRTVIESDTYHRGRPGMILDQKVARLRNGSTLAATRSGTERQDGWARQ